LFYLDISAIFAVKTVFVDEIQLKNVQASDSCVDMIAERRREYLL
jgi:hypothetical protein